MTSGPPLNASFATTYYFGQRRTLFEKLFGKGKNAKAQEPKIAPQNPLTEDYLKKKRQQPKPVPGDLAKSSIFEDEEQARPMAKPERQKESKLPRDPHIMAAALDPQPHNRMAWQRKMVIRQVRRRGRLSKAQLLKRQERELLLKSHDFKTSVKKLVPLAKQISGKTIDDAITQMRFSKKKAARDVKSHLVYARNKAILERGMGLGKVNSEAETYKPVTIITKDKKFVNVKDPTTIYVDQAWVGKGPHDKSLDHRARGRINIMRNPWTSVYSSCLLNQHAD